MNTSEKNGNKKVDEPRAPVRNAADLQRLKLEKLMKNPEKEVIIPERPKEKKLPPPPEFIRNVMGSSAGAGSGEFHVYRHLRRKEYSRQKFIQEQREKTKLDDEYQTKLLENQKAAEERAIKKREKRLKKMAKYKAAKKKKKLEGKEKNLGEDKGDSEGNDESSDEEERQKTDGNDDLSVEGRTDGQLSQEDSNDPPEQLDYSDDERKRPNPAT